MERASLRASGEEWFPRTNIPALPASQPPARESHDNKLKLGRFAEEVVLWFVRM